MQSPSPSSLDRGGPRVTRPTSPIAARPQVLHEPVEITSRPRVRPPREWVVDQRHPLADDSGPGSADRPLLTIGPAADRAGPGDTVIVHAGVYRERVSPSRGGEPGRPILYTAAEGERVVITGSDEVDGPWRSSRSAPRVFEACVPADRLGGADGPFFRALQGVPGRTCGEVFVDGEPLREEPDAGDLAASPGSWRYDHGRGVLEVHPSIGGDPLVGRLVEAAVRDRVFAPTARGLGHITVRGFVIQHAANNMCSGFWVEGNPYPQAGALGTRSGHHWIIEHNTVRFAKTLGIDCGAEGWHDLDGDDHGYARFSDTVGRHRIRHNRVVDNGGAGIAGFHSPYTRITDNAIERNARLGLTGSETAGIKVHGFDHGVIARNLLRDNDGPGAWLDNGWSHARVSRNLVVSNSGAGLFIELGDGPLLVDHNVVAFTTATMSLAGDGAYSHDASRVTFAHNLLFFNANFGLWSHVGTDRSRRGAEREGLALDQLTRASHWRVLNNLILGNHRGAVSLPVPSPRSRDNRSDHNLIAGGFHRLTSETYAEPLDPPELMVNTNKGRQRIGDLAAAWGLDASPKAAGPHDARLDLGHWQRVTGLDAHSGVPRVVRPTLSKRALFLQFLIDGAPRRHAAPPVPGVHVDYFGRPLPDRDVLPGPFGDIRCEHELEADHPGTAFRGPYSRIGNDRLNRWVLWPIPAQPATGGGDSEPATARD